MAVYLRKNYKLFGKLQLHNGHLFNNKLMVYYATGSPFQKLKTKTISNDLATILLDILDTEGKNEINQSIVGRLSDEERVIFKMLMDMSGLTQQMKYTHRPRTIDEVIARFKILQGSIDAGGDNELIVDELESLVKILKLAGRIVSTP